MRPASDTLWSAGATEAMRKQRRQSWPVVATFVAAIGVQVVLAAASIEVQSAVRSYVAGESLYSKGQKDAHIRLLDFVDRRRDEDYRHCLDALAIPLGDRAAREALERTPPDLEAARRGFLAGGNHPDDVGGLIWLYRWFSSSPLMAEPIATWKRGDAAIDEMRVLAERIHEVVISGDSRAAELHALRAQIHAQNTQLTELEREFSARLGETSRLVQRSLFVLNLAVAFALTLGGLWFVRQTLRARAVAAAEVHRQAHSLQKLIDAVADAVITVDTQGDVVLFNPAAERIFRRRAADVVGQPFEELLPPRLRDVFRGRLPTVADRPAVSGAPGALWDLSGMRGDGEEFPMEASVSQLETEQQGVLMTVVLRDVSEQQVARSERQAREALEAANRAKTEFLSRMSHELRTPLNAVLGFAELLATDAAWPLQPQQLLRVQHIRNAGAHLLALVSDVLDMSRVELGGIALLIGPVDVSGVADEAVAVVAQLAVSRSVTLVNKVSKDGADAAVTWVLADRVRLRQVLINLLSNAVKYTEAQGEAELSLESSGDEHALIVSDTGIGMTVEQLTHLFEPFNRLGAERSPVEGAGIGLVLTRHLVALMGGKLQISSTAGRGTVARATFRRASNPPAAAVSRGSAAVEEAKATQIDVLYAEDNEVNVELVRQVATLRPGVSLRVAASGALALEMARLDPPELMLVDMHLGDMTGTELAAALRRDPVTAGIRLVALSADALPQQISDAIEHGFESYLTKPINFCELLQVFDTHAAQRGREQAA
jgi:PAS domain S-box-containing protein